MTFLAATGDGGADSGLIYPSASPLVVGVGGTTLTVDGSPGNYSWGGETAWYGGGGGISNTYSEPSGKRASRAPATEPFRTYPPTPIPNTGVAVYDPEIYGGWVERRRHQPFDATLGRPDRRSPTRVARSWRRSASMAPTRPCQPSTPFRTTRTNYHDITVGSNGYPAGPGYDLATGIGTPMANNLIPGLWRHMAMPSQIAMTTRSAGTASWPAVCSAPSPRLKTPYGDTAYGYNGTATLIRAERSRSGTITRADHGRRGRLRWTDPARV